MAEQQGALPAASSCPEQATDASSRGAGHGKGKYYALNGPLLEGIDDANYAYMFKPIMQASSAAQFPSLGGPWSRWLHPDDHSDGSSRPVPLLPVDLPSRSFLLACRR